MMKQYNEIKQTLKDEILFFRLGDFYEMFGPDAIEASKILNITLTARGKGSANEMPMCGIPFHASENYIAKLTRAGKRVAICDQVSDPTLPGIVKREVVRIVTPGTTLDDKVLDNKNNNYLVNLILEKDTWGLSIVDLTVGSFQTVEIVGLEVLKNEVSRLQPQEVIVSDNLYNDSRFSDFINGLPNLNVFDISVYDKPDRLLLDHFNVKSLASFGIDEMPVAIKSAGTLLAYLKETQKTSLEHILKISRYALDNFMVLDQATIRNLEILNNAWTFEKEGSLLGVLDKTITAMGGRTLRRWLLMPLISKSQINQRLDAVGNLVSNTVLLGDLIDNLKQMSDFERLLGKIGCGRANARDLVALKDSLLLIKPIKELLKNNDSKLLKNYYNSIPDNTDLIKKISDTLVDEPSINLNDGGMIRDGYNKALDELRKISTSGKDWIRELQLKEVQRSGISSLKIKYNRVFGYYIEISNTNLSSVPENYIRKQTLVNAERYITPELKEYEEKVLGAEDKIATIEYQIFSELRENIIKYFSDVQATAKIISSLDVLVCFALLAKENNYCRPEISDAGDLEIEKGRHPVIEQFVDRYVPNDASLDHKKNEIILLTGPNMSGKSSFLRQVALITLMAHIGCYVPASKASIGVVDRIFTRVGASDNLSQGVSTFMNEMQEAANILNNATKRSLIILDEIGRGTSTYDGVSIAWSIIEYLHEKIQAKTLFATHYHELVDIIEKLDRAENFCVAVTEDKGSVVFLHQIIKGAASDSYGIEVAKLAGLPDKLITRAQQILGELEQKSSIKLAQKPQQASLNLSAKEEILTKALAEVDPNNMTPLEALQKLNDFKKLEK